MNNHIVYTHILYYSLQVEESSDISINDFISVSTHTDFITANDHEIIKQIILSKNPFAKNFIITDILQPQYTLPNRTTCLNSRNLNLR